MTLKTEESEFDFIDDLATMTPDADGFVDEDSIPNTKNNS